LSGDHGTRFSVKTLAGNGFYSQGFLIYFNRSNVEKCDSLESDKLFTAQQA
jgi:hypothetical protein